MSNTDRQKNEKFEREIRILKQKNREKKKKMEAMRINADERLTMAMEKKD